MVYRRLRRYSERFRWYLRERVVLRSRWVDVERQGFQWRLDTHSYIGRTIAQTGTFEPVSTQLVRDLVKPGMTVLDVGANIGYFTVLLAQCVGDRGLVWAFEPLSQYRNQLQWHVNRNKLMEQTRILPFGLSDRNGIEQISVGDSSATLHWVSDSNALSQEKIELRVLDEVVREHDIGPVNFIKMDVDGHEPMALQGALCLIKRDLPTILLEFNQANLYQHGSNVLEQARTLRELGYVLCNESTRRPFISEMAFLRCCGNFDHSCNVLALHQNDPCVSLK